MRTVSGRDRTAEFCADLLEDESNISGSWCEMAAWPENLEEAAGIMAECSREGLSVTLSGGLTGIAGGALPEGGAVVSTALLRELEMLDDNRIRAGAGVTLEELRRFLSQARSDAFYPPDPTEETATVGGTVATDASGSDSFLYGATGKWVEAVTVVLAGGRSLRIRRGEYRFDEYRCSHPVLGDLQLPRLGREQPAKNAAGYNMRPGMDLVDLFVGSEGTLGLVAEAELKLAPSPLFVIDLAVFPENEVSFWDLYSTLQGRPAGLRLRALEMMDTECLTFMRQHPGDVPQPPDEARFALLLRAEADGEEGMEDALVALDGALVACGTDPDAAWGGFEPSEHRKMKDFRHSLPESVNHRISELRRTFPGIHKFGSDGAVPPGRLREYYSECRIILEDLRLPHLIFGHAGQGHIHANAIPEDPEALPRAEEAMRLIAAAAVDMGGTISAEHGLGKLKMPYLGLMYSEDEIAGMQLLRRSLDPEMRLNRAMSFPVAGS